MIIKRYKLLQFLGLLTVAVCHSYSQKLSSNNAAYFESSRISARNPSAITDQVDSKDADISLRNSPNLRSASTRDYTTDNFQAIFPIQSRKDSSHLTSLHSSAFQKRLGSDSSNLHEDSLPASVDSEDSSNSSDADTELNTSRYESLRLRGIPHSRVNKRKFRNENHSAPKAQYSQLLKKTGEVKSSLTETETEKDVEVPGKVKNYSEGNVKRQEVKNNPDGNVKRQETKPENVNGKAPNKRLKRKKLVRVKQRLAKSNTSKDEANDNFSEQKPKANFNAKSETFSDGARNENSLKSHEEAIDQDDLHKQGNTQYTNREMDEDIQPMKRTKNVNNMDNRNYLLNFLRNIGEKLTKDHEQSKENETPEWVAKHGSKRKGPESSQRLVSFNHMGRSSLSGKDFPKMTHHTKVGKPAAKKLQPSPAEKASFKKVSNAKDVFYTKKERTYFNQENKRRQQASDFQDEDDEQREELGKKENEDVNDHLEFLNPSKSLFHDEKNVQKQPKNQPPTVLVKRKQPNKHKKPVWQPTVTKKNTRNNKLNNAKGQFHNYRPEINEHPEEYDNTEDNKYAQFPGINQHNTEYDDTDNHKYAQFPNSNNNRKKFRSKSVSTSENGNGPFYFTHDLSKGSINPTQKSVENDAFEDIIPTPHKLDNGGYFMHMYNRMGSLGLGNFDLNSGEVPPVDGHVSEMTLRWTDDDTKAVVEAFLDITKNSGNNDEALFGEDFDEQNYGDFALTDEDRGNFGGVESENSNRYSNYEPYEDSSSFSSDNDFENESTPENTRKKRSASNDTEPYVKSYFNMDEVEVKTNYTPKDDTTKADFLKRIGHPVNTNQTKIVVYVSPTPVQSQNPFDKKEDQNFDAKQNKKENASNVFEQVGDATLTTPNAKTNIESGIVKSFFLTPSEAQEKQRIEHEFQARNSYFLFDKYKQPQRESFQTFQTYQSPKVNTKNKTDAQVHFKPKMRENGNMHRSYTLEKPNQISTQKTNFSSNLKSSSSSESTITQSFSDFSVPTQSNIEFIKTDKEVLETKNSEKQLNSNIRNSQKDTKNLKDKMQINTDHFLSSEKPRKLDVKMFFRKNNVFGERQNGTNGKLGIERKDNEWLYTEDENGDLDNSHHSSDHFDDNRQAEYSPAYTLEDNRFQNEDTEGNRGMENGYSFDFGRNEWTHGFQEVDNDYPTYSSIPKTDFTCRGKKRPGYYADTEAGCQVFHMCQQTGEKHSFLCPNTTVFNQQLLVCDWHSNVKCEKSESFYDINEHIYQPAVQLSEYDHHSRQNSKRTDGRAEVLDEFPKTHQQQENREKRPKEISWLPKFPAFNSGSFPFSKPTTENIDQEDDVIVDKETDERTNAKIYKFDENKDRFHSRTRSKKVDPQFLHLYNTRESPQQEKRSEHNPKYLEVKSSWDPIVLKKLMEDELRTTPEGVRSLEESNDDDGSNALYFGEENSSVPSDVFDYSANTNTGKQKVTESGVHYYEKNSRKLPGKNSNSSKNIYNRKQKSYQKVYTDDDQDTSESTESVSKTIPARKKEKENGKSNYDPMNHNINIFNTTSGKLVLLPHGSNHGNSKYKQHFDETEIRKPINIIIPYHSKEYKTIPNGVTYQTEGQIQDDVTETATNPVSPRYTYPHKALTQINAAEKEFNYGHRTETPVTVRNPSEKSKDYTPNNKFPIQDINLRIADIKTGIENIGSNVAEILQNNDKTFKNVRVFKLKSKILPIKKDVQVSPFKFERQSVRDRNLRKNIEHQVLPSNDNEPILETPQYTKKTEPNYITENPATYKFSNKQTEEYLLPEKHTLENVPHQSWLTDAPSQNTNFLKNQEANLEMKLNSDERNADISTTSDHFQDKQKFIVKPLAKPYYITNNKEHVDKHPVTAHENDFQEHKNYQNEGQISRHPVQYTIKRVPVSKNKVNQIVLNNRFKSQKLVGNKNHEDVNYKPSSSLDPINEQNDFIPTVPMKYFSIDKIPKDNHANEYSTRLRDSNGRNTNKVIIIPLLPKTNVVHLQNSERFLKIKAFDDFDKQVEQNNKYQPHHKEMHMPQKYLLQKKENKENIHLRQKEPSSNLRKVKPYYIIPAKSLPKYENSGEKLIVETFKRPPAVRDKIENTFNHPRKYSSDKYKTIKVETDLSADCEESLEHNRIPPEIQLGKNGPTKIIPHLYRNLYPQFPKSTAQDLSDGSQSRCNDRSTVQEDAGKNEFEQKNLQPIKHKIEKINYPSPLFIKQIQDFRKNTGFLKNKDKEIYATNMESLSGNRKPLQDTSHQVHEGQIHTRPPLAKPIIRQKLVLKDNLENKHHPSRQLATKQDHRSSIESKEHDSNERLKPVNHDRKSYYEALEKAAEFRTQKTNLRPVASSTADKNSPTRPAFDGDDEISHTSEESRDIEERIPSSESARYAALEKEAELKAERMIRKKSSPTTNKT